MAGIVLLVLTEGFDDMAYLSNQVILEEAGNDVISASPNGGAVKGGSSSAMTVSLSEALDQDLDYSALVLVGGSEVDSIDNIAVIIDNFNSENKLIAGIGSAVELLTPLTSDVSNDSSIVESGHIISMKVPENSEEFAEIIASKI